MSALASGMPVGRTAVSMHLRVLKDAGLVQSETVGNRRVYRVEPDALRRLREHLDWYWEQSLAAYREAAESKAREERVASEPEVLVAKSVTVQAPLATAFDVFIGMAWWPLESHHIAKQPGVEAIFEPYSGGRWYERAEDGSETDWGTVLSWQPPHRILLSWQVNPQWEYEPDPLLGSEIEVTFTSEAPEITRVELVHRHLERYGDQTERMRQILDGRGGEPLDVFARHFETRKDCT